MILIVENRRTFHLLPGDEAAPRSTALALQHMGWSPALQRVAAQVRMSLPAPLPAEPKHLINRPE